MAAGQSQPTAIDDSAVARRLLTHTLSRSPAPRPRAQGEGVGFHRNVHIPLGNCHDRLPVRVPPGKWSGPTPRRLSLWARLACQVTASRGGVDTRCWFHRCRNSCMINFAFLHIVAHKWKIMFKNQNEMLKNEGEKMARKKLAALPLPKKRLKTGRDWA